MLKVLLIGSSGFVGKHIKEVLTNEVLLITTTRQVAYACEGTIYFDLLQPESWLNVSDLGPDIIINAAGYGVVKEQTDVNTMYDVNYRFPVRFITFLQTHSCLPFWLQIGTAFEYDLEIQQLTESSACIPLTHYGISKAMCSNFLLSGRNQLSFLLVRPFAMFGPYETASKLLPYLINAQLTGRPIALSTGEQQRDYFYVKDLAIFLRQLIKNDLHKVANTVMNIGRGIPLSLFQLASELSSFITDFKPSLWQWGQIPQRDNENQVFYNASDKAATYNLQFTPLSEAFKETIAYYAQQQ